MIKCNLNYLSTSGFSPAHLLPCKAKFLEEVVYSSCSSCLLFLNLVQSCKSVLVSVT